MIGSYVLHCYQFDSRLFTPYLHIKCDSVEYYPKRKKLKGYQKAHKHGKTNNQHSFWELCIPQQKSKIN